MDINSGFNAQWQTVQGAEHAQRRHAEVVARDTAQTERAEEVETTVVQDRDTAAQAHVGASVVRAPDETVGTIVDEKV